MAFAERITAHKTLLNSGDLSGVFLFLLVVGMKKWFKWFIHNSVVHPIMPFLPKKIAIKLHDKNGEWAFKDD